MGLTVQQQLEIEGLALAYLHDGEFVSDLNPLLQYIDKLADARVVAFAQAALRANDVAKHCENTLIQYVALGL